MGSVSLAPTLTPHGRLVLGEAPDTPLLDLDLAQRLRNAFERESGHGLLQLGATEVGATSKVLRTEDRRGPESKKGAPLRDCSLGHRWA
jgi:hypothetical protein